MTALWLFTGCQSEPRPQPPLATPAVVTQLSQYTGTPLSGPRAAEVDVGLPKDALDVSVKWVAVQTIPASAKETLASQCRLIVAGQSNTPMLSFAELTKDVLFVRSNDVRALEAQFDGPATAAFAPISTLEGALPSKVTASFAAAIAAGPSPRNRITLRIARAPEAAIAPATQAASQAIEMTLEIAEDASVSTTQPSIITSETAVFDRSLVDGQDQLALVIPAKLADSSARALIALVDITQATTAATLAKCQDNLQASSLAASLHPTTAATQGSAWAGYDSALNALGRSTDRRSALVFLAAQTSAHICEDTALVAKDALLERLADTVAQEAAASSEPHSTAALSWLLDHSAFELLATSDAPGNDGNAQASAPLPPELKAVLTVYAGEPARHPGSLDEIARQSSSWQDLENRLTAENLVFLTDASPASRVRAFDWLKARGLAPAGFDPLGTGRQRRQALDKLLSDSN